MDTLQSSLLTTDELIISKNQRNTLYNLLATYDENNGELISNIWWTQCTTHFINNTMCVSGQHGKWRTFQCLFIYFYLWYLWMLLNIFGLLRILEWQPWKMKLLLLQQSCGLKCLSSNTLDQLRFPSTRAMNSLKESWKKN